MLVGLQISPKIHLYMCNLILTFQIWRNLELFMPQIYLIRFIRTIRIIINIIIVFEYQPQSTRQWLHKVESIWTIQHIYIFPHRNSIRQNQIHFHIQEIKSSEKKFTINESYIKVHKTEMSEACRACNLNM